MNFLRSNYKMILVIGFSIIIQIGVVAMLFNPSGKDKKLIDSTIGRENMENMVHGTDEMDAIDESKNNAVSGHRTSNETHEDSEGMEEIIEHESQALQVGKTDVQVGYVHREPTTEEINKTTGKVSGTNKKSTETTEKKPNKGNTTNTGKKPTRKPSNKPSNKPKDDNSKTSSNKTDKKDTIEDVKKKIIGKWKSVNDSDDKKSNMYWEFDENGSYENYDEDLNKVYSGKYKFSSPGKIKIIGRNLNESGEIKEDKETFTSDINFKDSDSFTVMDIENFDFSNYKKVQD